MIDFRKDIGTVVGPAEWTDYVFIDLDEPCIYYGLDIVELPRIRVLVDNLEVIHA